MAQRMESAAPPGAVMLSASTARLVDGPVALGEPQGVRIKGAESPVVTHRLLGIGERTLHRVAVRPSLRRAMPHAYIPNSVGSRLELHNGPSTSMSGFHLAGRYPDSSVDVIGGHSEMPSIPLPLKRFRPGGANFFDPSRPPPYVVVSPALSASTGVIRMARGTGRARPHRLRRVTNWDGRRAR